MANEVVKPSHAVAIESLCVGSPFAQGQAQGAAVADKIRAAQADLARLESFRLQQPWWLPYSLYLRAAAKAAWTKFALPLATHYPDALERLRGLTAGSGVDNQQLALFNAFEALISSISDSTCAPSGCSAVAVRGRRTVDGQAMIARNFDYVPLVQPYFTLRDSRPTNGLRSLEFTTAPLVGAIDGMNEAGLAITYNYAYAADAPTPGGGPISLAISEALAHCTTVAEAAAWVDRRPRLGGGILMLADATGDVASLELSNRRLHVRTPNEQDAIYHTNCFVSETMRAHQLPLDAIYSDRAPLLLRGQPVYLSSKRRDARLESLLADHDLVTPDELSAILADHQTAAGDDTLCMHGEYWSTNACLQFFPAERRLRVAYGHACQAEFAEFVL